MVYDPFAVPDGTCISIRTCTCLPAVFGSKSPVNVSQAIDRAAGMVGMIKSAPEPVKPPRGAVPIAALDPRPTTYGNGHAVAAKTAEPVTAKKYEAPKVAPPIMPVAPPATGESAAAKCAA